MTKMPYFDSYLSFQRSSGQDSTQLPTHDEIPFFRVIDKGINDGFRHFFRCMPTRLSDYRLLCETLEFLCVDVLSTRNIRSIMDDFQSGKNDRDERNGKSPARDSAFRLLYLFLLGDFESDLRDSNLAYQATLFVVSHREIFEYRIRQMVREAYEERFDASVNQLHQLDKWPIDPPALVFLEDELAIGAMLFFAFLAFVAFVLRDKGPRQPKGNGGST